MLETKFGVSIITVTFALAISVFFSGLHTKIRVTDLVNMLNVANVS